MQSLCTTTASPVDHSVMSLCLWIVLGFDDLNYGLLQWQHNSYASQRQANDDWKGRVKSDYRALNVALIRLNFPGRQRTTTEFVLGKNVQNVFTERQARGNSCLWNTYSMSGTLNSLIYSYKYRYYSLFTKKGNWILTC